MLKVCVLICVYNGSKTIERCLDSLLAQDYPKEFFEIIVVENGSTDNTTEIVERYPVRLYHSPVQGIALARNMGVESTDADIVAFTDADCVAEPNWISELVKPFDDPSIGGVGGMIEDYVHPERTMVEVFAGECKPLVTFVTGKNEFLPHLFTANCAYRRKTLNQIGNFNVGLSMGSDVDASWRIQLETGSKLAYVPEAVIYHHHRSTRNGLARQYRRYGFGEIMLDTLFGKYPGYPRTRSVQMRRILQQTLALPRYMVSIAVREFRYRRGTATEYQVMMPRLWFLIERSNIQGKLEALIATRFMHDAQHVLQKDKTQYLRRYFQVQKE